MPTLVELASQIISSQASTTSMTVDEILSALDRVHGKLTQLETGTAPEPAAAAAAEEAKPALTLKDAFKKNEVVCMVCGKGGFKTLTRHLSTSHGLKPSQYRKQFGISSKQSLSAKSTTEARRKIAIDRGLAGNLAKAREVRMANIEAKKTPPPKAQKPTAPAKAAKAKAPAKVPKGASLAAKAPKTQKAPATPKAAKATK